MNYIPVSTRNQTDKNAGPQDTNGNAGTQDNIDAGKEVSDQHYIVLPLWSSISSTFKSSDDKAADDKPKDDTGSKTTEEPINKEDQAYKDELDRLMSQEKEASGAADALRKESEQGCMDQRGATEAGSTNPVNTVSNPVNVVSTSGTFSTGGPSSPHPDTFIPANTLLHASTPIETQKPLVKYTKATDVDVHLYRSMIGSLMYLTASRPDIMFAVCACSRFQVTSKLSHLHDVKRIFRYLKGQPKLGLWYPRDFPFDLEDYLDSDYARANLDRKFTIGEYVAAANCCGQVLWIQNQMLDYDYNFMNTKIYIDNESTICKGSGNPPESQPTPSPAQPINESQISESSSSPQNTQSPRQTLEGTSFSHTRTPNFLDPRVDVEAVHKEGAATTGEGSGSGPGLQETMGGEMTQIRYEGALIQSIDSPLSTGYTVGSGEDKMEHDIEFTDLVPQTPHDSPLSRGHTPGNFHPFRAGASKRNCLGKRKVSKQGRKNLKSQQMFQDNVLDEDADTEMIVEDKGNGEKEGSTTETVSTARPDISAARIEISTAEPKTPPTTTTFFDDEDVTIAVTLVKIKNQKTNEKGIAFKDADDFARPIRSITKLQPLPTIDPKDKDVDHELAIRLTLEEQEKYAVEERSKLLAEFFKRRKKQLAKERAEAIKSKPHTKTQLRNLMMTYLKHTGRFTHAQLKSRSFEEIQKLYIKEQIWVDAFVPIGSEKDKKRIESRKKRAACSSSKHKSTKKQKVNDQDSEDSDKEHKKCLKVVSADDKAIDYETLDVKSPIVDCESQVLGTNEAGDVHVYKLTSLDGSYRHFSTFSRMLEVLDRQDVLDLHKIIMERFLANDPEGYDLILWGYLKTLVESSEDDEIWRNQQDWKLLS
nr:hypothetical protein [Tanacetum cinerariifolium]